ncbi:MAG: ABC transporter substrate-binding protein [Nitrospirae bacterium]|nr:ABC transporter substrate-binding protein [Nitrospirota bacterium]
MIVFFLVSNASAGVATDLVKQTTDSVLDVLKSKELKKPARTKERRSAIRKIISERFDFEEMAKRSLARYWKQRTPEEQKEFVGLYTDLLERTYIRKIESYNDEQFVYGDEIIDGVYAVVKTKIVTKKNIDVLIDYKMFNKNGTWLAYDVVIEGVSLVNNYRNQFNQIIHSGSYEDVTRKLKDKEIEGLAEDKVK